MSRNEPIQSMQPLNAAVERALEQAPAVQVPQSFAARVAAAAAVHANAQPQGGPPPIAPKLRRFAVGRTALLASLPILTVALFVVAPSAGTHMQSWPFALEMLLLAQLAGAGYGLMRLDREGL